MQFSILSKIKDKKLKTSIDTIILIAEEFHRTPFLYSFTDHSVSHSNRMLQCIEKLLKECGQTKQLNEYECYVLVAAIYLHDIGIQVSNPELLKEFAEQKGLEIIPDTDIADFVRNNHHWISSYLIKRNIKGKRDPLVYAGDKDLGRYISLVIEAHGIDFSKKVSHYHKYIYNDKYIRVDLLSVLLCLADCFDCDKRRIDSNKFKYVDLPKVSRIHWMKHLYVRGISFNNRVITISYTFPKSISNQTNEVYKEFFCQETEKWLNVTKDAYLSLLNDANLVFDIKREVNFDEDIEPLDNDDYEYIEQFLIDSIYRKDRSVYQQVSIGILIQDNHILMVKRKKPEKSLSTTTPGSVLEWQFPAGMVKAQNTPEDTVLNEVLKETGIKSSVKEYLGRQLHPDTSYICCYYLLQYVDGKIANGDPAENANVSWIPLSDCRSKITSSIYWKVDKVLKDCMIYES